MPGIDWNLAIHYANLVDIAYGVLPGADYGASNIAQIQAAGYTFLQALYGNELATDVDPHIGETVTYGFLALSNGGGELVCIIRGTATLDEWIHDASFLMVPNPIKGGSGMTEDGFTAIYKSLRISRDLQSMTAVASIASYLSSGQAQTANVAGHSLGAALANLTAMDIALNSGYRTPVLYTFASPRTGDHSFAGMFNALIAESYRVVNRSDLVPNLPPILPLPYEHTNTLFELVEPMGAIQQNVLCAHILSTYLWLMGQAAGGANPYPVQQGCQGSAYPGPPVPPAIGS